MKNDIIKNLTFIVLITILFCIQSTNGLLPTEYRIDILIPILISIAVLNDIYSSVISAFLVSFIYEYNYGMLPGISTIFFVTLIIAVHFLSTHYYTKNIITALMFSTITILLFRVLIYLFILDNFLFFFKVTSAEVILTTILSPFAYFVVKYISRNFEVGEK